MRHEIKQVFVFSVLILTAVGVLAQNISDKYIFVGKTFAGNTYINKLSLQRDVRNADVIWAWLVTIPTKRDVTGFAYGQELHAIDCSSLSYRVDQAIGYDSSNSIIFSNRFSNQYEPYAPNSLGEAEVRLICN